MASSEHFVKFIVDQIAGSGAIRYGKLFGEYAIYRDDKVVAFVCDDQLFVKQTAGGRTFIGDVVEAPHYPGSKLSFLIQDQIDDKEWLSELISITAQELPAPKPKKKKK